jgi:hypothetical protein
MADWVDLVSQNNAMMSPQTAATTDYLRAQTVGQQLTNERSAMGLDFMRRLAGGGFGAPGTPVAPSGAPGVSPAASADGATPNAQVTSVDPDEFVLNEPAARQHVFSRFAPIPDVWSPEEQQARVYAAMSGVPGAVDAVKAQHDTRISSLNAARMKAAQQQYNDLYAVSTAPDGRALDALSLVDPQAAERLRAAGVTDEQVRDHAARLAGITHSVAGLPVEYRKDGVAVDKTSQQPVPGYDTAVGLSAENRADLVKAAQTMTTVKRSDGSEENVPQWKADGAPSLEAWVSRAGQIAAAHGASPATVTAAAGVAPGVTAPSAPPVRVAPPPAAAAATSQDPTAKAYADPDYKLNTQPVRVGVSATPGAIAEQQAVTKAKTDLLEEQSDNAKAAGQALRYYTLAQKIINSGNAITGWKANDIANVRNALSQFGINPNLFGDPSKTAELVKALTNAGLQNLKTTYGSRVTQSEVFLNLQHANPNADMPLPALRQLINDQVDNLHYDVQSAFRANRYVATGNDPRKFETWNQQYFPREKVAVDRGGLSAKVMPTGVRLQAYAAAHFGGDTQKAQQYLSSQGYK